MSSSSRVNTNANDPAARETIRASYEFAVAHVGQDKDAGDIWKDYVDFLKSGTTSNTWEAQQRMDALRSVYHRAVVIPLENVELLWRELDSFETTLNKITVSNFMTTLECLLDLSTRSALFYYRQRNSLQISHHRT